MKSVVQYDTWFGNRKFQHIVWSGALIDSGQHLVGSNPYHVEENYDEKFMVLKICAAHGVPF